MRQIAYVSWVDSTSYKKIQDGDEINVDTIETAGLVVKETDSFIAISNNFNHTPDTYTENIVIPKVCVKKLEIFDIS